MTTFNAPLARQVLTYIREHPEQHNQTTYVEPAEGTDLHVEYDGWEGEEPDVVVVAETIKPTNGEYLCMTTACIAGWAVALAGPEAVRQAWDSLNEHQREQEAWFETGAALLGMTRSEAQEIFLNFDEDDALEMLEAMITAAEAPA